MNQKQIRAAVEAMLFACGDPIGADKLAQAIQLPQVSVEAALEALQERYTREDSGLCLLHLNTRWQLATKTQWADCVRRVLDSRRAVPLGPAAMETLTVTSRCPALLLSRCAAWTPRPVCPVCWKRTSLRKPDVLTCRAGR